MESTQALGEGIFRSDEKDDEMSDPSGRSAPLRGGCGAIIDRDEERPEESDEV
jgi:hypothetical protein